MNRNAATGARLYIGNLPYEMTPEELVSEFAYLGYSVQKPHIVTNQDTGRSKGFGFVEAASPQEAAEIVAQCSGSQLGGRTVKIDHAIDRPRSERNRSEQRR